MSPHAVFLSYAREDATAAQRLADALRAFGVDAWIDQSQLRGGDAWDQGIRRQIKDCALFIPVISARTQARGEGYFRLEWTLAEERAQRMAKGVPFIVPVAIDDTPEAHALVPEAFLRSQWTRLPNGTPTPQFVEQVQRLLSQSRKPVPGADPAAGEANPAHFAGLRSWWRPLLVVAVIALAAGVVWWNLPFRGTTIGVGRTPVVVLMDSPAPDRVYDPATLRDHGTNADDLTHLLGDLPISLVKESTGSSWDREAEVVRVNPALIVVHRSCFYTFPNDDARESDLYPYAADKLLALIGYLATVNPRTKFLVYSRMSWADETAAAKWRAEAAVRFPALAGRLETYPVPAKRATFRDPLTGREVREIVERMLGLSGQPGASK